MPIASASPESCFASSSSVSHRSESREKEGVQSRSRSRSRHGRRPAEVPRLKGDPAVNREGSLRPQQTVLTVPSRLWPCVLSQLLPARTNSVIITLVQSCWSQPGHSRTASIIQTPKERTENETFFILQSKCTGEGKTGSFAVAACTWQNNLLRGFDQIELNRASFNDALPRPDNNRDRLQPTTASASDKRKNNVENEVVITGLVLT